mgnify:CR=1 FL=1
MKNPVNVPTENTMRFFFWSKENSTIGQRSHLKVLFGELGVTAEELYGEDFTTLDDLSKWSAHWGIQYMRAAQEAWFAHAYYNRIEREQKENAEAEFKRVMAQIVREDL